MTDAIVMALCGTCGLAFLAKAGLSAFLPPDWFALTFGGRPRLLGLAIGVTIAAVAGALLVLSLMVAPVR